MLKLYEGGRLKNFEKKQAKRTRAPGYRGHTELMGEKNLRFGKELEGIRILVGLLHKLASPCHEDGNAAKKSWLLQMASKAFITSTVSTACPGEGGFMRQPP